MERNEEFFGEESYCAVADEGNDSSITTITENHLEDGNDVLTDEGPIVGNDGMIGADSHVEGDNKNDDLITEIPSIPIDCILSEIDNDDPFVIPKSFHDAILSCKEL